jgi:tryptophan synthase alpha subunit
MCIRDRPWLRATADRIKLAVARSQGFVYLVSVTGITGARDSFPPDLNAFVQRVRAEALRQSPTEPTYLAVGFGISNPELASQVAGLADGVIVGSALVKLAANSHRPAVEVAELGAALAGATVKPTP